MAATRRLQKRECPKKLPADLSIGAAELAGMQQKHADDPGAFWHELGCKYLDCSRKWQQAFSGSFTAPPVRWFPGARLNASSLCLDRHLKRGLAEKLALIWQGEQEDNVETFTYIELHRLVCRFAAVLKKRGVARGDSVCLYLPMIPELVIAMLACARIGAVHSVVFSGFSSQNLVSRIDDCQAKLLVTADGVSRSGRVLPLKANAEEALEECRSLCGCIVVQRVGRDTVMTPERDSWYHEEMCAVEPGEDVEEMAAEDTLFVLYTSGSTGRAKGIAHATAGYMLYAQYSFDLVFGLAQDDVFWCTADIGWITGHTYGVYGPLALGGTSLIFEGSPLYPGPERYWNIIDKFNVTVFYTAPTAIRALMRFGTEPLKGCDLSSLRLLGSVGEPINREAWLWYHQHIGGGRLRIADTWWQTETGGVMIAPLCSSPLDKAGSAAKPLPGIRMRIVDDQGGEMPPEKSGRLIITEAWPGMYKEIRSLSDSTLPISTQGQAEVYDTGDGARCDKDGWYWITGRLDDVINVSGHRLGTAEIEAALLTHPGVAEAAVVGVPHQLKGQSVYAYVTPKRGVVCDGRLFTELQGRVRSEIGPLASPDFIQYAFCLPKTRSGKIMRRVLQKIAGGSTGDFGDISSLADPSVIAHLIEGSSCRKDTNPS